VRDYAVSGWAAALDIEGAAPNTVRAYRAAVVDLAKVLPGSVLDAKRGDIRGWLVQRKAEGRSAATLSLYLKAVKLFYRWLVEEGDLDHSPAEGIKGPPVAVPTTPVLDAGQRRALARACDGNDLAARRDLAIVMVLLDTGLRLAECAGLTLGDVDLEGGHLVVRGKGARRRGPRVRVAPFGARTGRAVSRYLRARQQLDLDHDSLWANSRRPYTPMVGRRIAAMLTARGERAGIDGLHPHMLRHTWASQFRQHGGNEGDLMVLGGWSSRAMLDRYGAHDATQRAYAAGRRLSLADRL